MKMTTNSTIKFEKYYAIYKRKETLGEVKSENFIDFCFKLKLSGAKPKHILCYNLLESDLVKAFELIESPKKKKVNLIGFLGEQNFKGDDLVIFKTSTYHFREDQIVSIDSIRKHENDETINFMFFAGYIEFYRA